MLSCTLVVRDENGKVIDRKTIRTNSITLNMLRMINQVFKHNREFSLRLIDGSADSFDAEMLVWGRCHMTEKDRPCDVNIVLGRNEHDEIVDDYFNYRIEEDEVEFSEIVNIDIDVNLEDPTKPYSYFGFSRSFKNITNNNIEVYDIGFLYSTQRSLEEPEIKRTVCIARILIPPEERPVIPPKCTLEVTVKFENYF